MKFERVLVVDDDPAVRRMLVANLQKKGIAASGSGTMRQTLDETRREPPDLMILDIKLPDGDGLAILQSVKQLNPQTEVIMMTGFGSIETALEAMRLGAANYLMKPFSMGHFDLALQQLTDQYKLREENRILRNQLSAEDDEDPLLFASPEMERVGRLISRVATTNATVLIQGESGTGKELVAKALHRQSHRSSQPYIRLNCAAVPETLLESEFFGHERGAFTGANQRREGRFEAASGGTLLLDEVTEISTGLQAKLLRVLQEQEFERVGGNRTLQVDVRIIATTNRSLEKAVEKGEFRQDLFYRLNVVPLHIPPLRERTGDVEFLLNEFLARFARRHGKEVPTISPSALEQLKTYPWPGNVRELRNYTERAVILSARGRDLQISDFALSAGQESKHDSALDTAQGFPTVAEMERRLIYMALEQTSGQRNEAAKLLGINVRTLRNKLNEYEGKPESKKQCSGAAEVVAA